MPKYSHVKYKVYQLQVLKYKVLVIVNMVQHFAILYRQGFIYLTFLSLLFSGTIYHLVQGVSEKISHSWKPKKLGPS